MGIRVKGTGAKYLTGGPAPGNLWDISMIVKVPTGIAQTQMTIFSAENDIPATAALIDIFFQYDGTDVTFGYASVDDAGTNTEGIGINVSGSEALDKWTFLRAYKTATDLHIQVAPEGQAIQSTSTPWVETQTFTISYFAALVSEIFTSGVPAQILPADVEFGEITGDIAVWTGALDENGLPAVLDGNVKTIELESGSYVIDTDAVPYFTLTTSISSPDYLLEQAKMIKYMTWAMFYYRIQKPTIGNLEKLYNILYNLPFAYEGGAASISGQGCTIGNYTYYLPVGESWSVSNGQEIERFQPLTSGIQIKDRVSHPTEIEAEFGTLKDANSFILEVTPSDRSSYSNVLISGYEEDFINKAFNKTTLI